MTIDNVRAGSETSPPHSAPGRPLDSTRDDVLCAAALKLLGEIGYDRLTVDKIAASAGAGKATIYRRWSGKAELVVDALSRKKAVESAANTGSLRGDLHALACRADAADRQLDTPVMIGLVSALPHDKELRDAFRERLIEPHVATLLDVFQRAQIRGEIAPGGDLHLVISLLPALVLHRLLIEGTAPDQAFIEQIIDDVILPLVYANSSASRSS
ncbi:MAG: transcriptional regulator, TetR family [Acidimicrobiaceae bacterium]|nr:transcriptional regulator, TetR family [Acidimicrobiaceae bacterium]